MPCRPPLGVAPHQQHLRPHLPSSVGRASPRAGSWITGDGVAILAAEAVLVLHPPCRLECA